MVIVPAFHSCRLQSPSRLLAIVPGDMSGESCVFACINYVSDSVPAAIVGCYIACMAFVHFPRMTSSVCR